MDNVFSQSCIFHFALFIFHFVLFNFLPTLVDTFLLILYLFHEL